MIFSNLIIPYYCLDISKNTKLKPVSLLTTASNHPNFESGTISPTTISKGSPLSPTK
jgi:hypothetical protein